MKTQEDCANKATHFERDLSEGAVAAKGEGVTRRSFVGGMGAMMAAAAAMAAGSKTAFAGEADEAADEEDAEASEVEAGEEDEEAAAAVSTEAETVSSSYPVIESSTGWTGTPEDVLELGVSTMPLDDLNQYRQAYLDAQSDYTCEDGTVIPSAYVKVRALINTYGMGCGNTPYDTCFDGIMGVFSQDDAQAYIDMPMGVEFTAYEMAEKEGRDVDECTEICERLAEAGFLFAVDNNRGRCYHHVAMFQGVSEYNLRNTATSSGEYSFGVAGYDYYDSFATTGTPVFYFVPVDESTTSDGSILPFDDVKAKVQSRNLCAIAPCYCRYTALASTYGYENIPSLEDFNTGEYEEYFSDLCDQRVETCIMTGDEAAYWIEMGLAREITGEQAAEYLQRSVDDGFMLESTFGKNSETICSCHIDSCGILAQWTAMGDAETIASIDPFKQVSHYTLEVDADLCIACGTCVDRCPMHTITINDEGWAEAGANCFRCGQCAYVCPQNARHLVQRDESELAPLPQGMLEDANVKAAYRFEKGLITFPEASESTDETSETTEEAVAEETATEETATEEAVE